jgi:tetratricopeptide (TPR) repeat protein
VKSRPALDRVRLAAIGCLVASAVAAGSAFPRQREDEARSWLVAVRTHTPGRNDPAVSTLASWSNADLNAVVSRAFRLPPDDLARWLWPDDPDTFLRRAIVLHTDVAVLSHADDGYSLPPTDRAVIEIGDGQQRVVRLGTVQWALARQLAAALSQPKADSFVRRWYDATSAQLQSWNDYSELTPHLAAGIRLFDDDARLLLYRAAMHEDYAGPRIQGAIGGASTVPAPVGGLLGSMRPPPPGPDVTHTKAYELNAAEADLRRALALDPSLVEASLRLGHVLGERGRHGDAAAALVRALAAPGLTVELQYDGWLLLGRERVAINDVPGARDALGRAAALVPGAQSAQLALSQMARASGDRPRALAALRSLSTDPPADDPWWTYTRAHAPTAEALLDDVRRSLDSRGGRQ